MQMNYIYIYMYIYIYSPPGSSVHGILQARILEWVAIPQEVSKGLPDPGIEPSLPHCRQILYCLSHREGMRNFQLPRSTSLVQGQLVVIVLLMTSSNMEGL